MVSTSSVASLRWGTLASNPLQSYHVQSAVLGLEPAHRRLQLGGLGLAIDGAGMRPGRGLVGGRFHDNQLFPHVLAQGNEIRPSDPQSRFSHEPKREGGASGSG